MKSATIFVCLVLSVLLSGAAAAKGGRQLPKIPVRRFRPINETKLFIKADTDNSTCLSVEELMKSRICKMLPGWVAPKVLIHYDANYTDGCLNLDEFKALFADSQASEPYKLLRLIKRLRSSYPKVLIVNATAIFEKADKLDSAQSDCLTSGEFKAAILMLGGGNLPLWVVDVLLAEYAADDTCLTKSEYNTFVPEFRALRRADIFDRAVGDDSDCLSAMEFLRAAQAAIGRKAEPLAVLAFFALDDANSNDCLEEAEFDAFMDRLEI